MPEHMSLERRAVMTSFGAEILLTPKEGSMEAAIDLAREMQAGARAGSWTSSPTRTIPRAHYEGTGPEIWRDTRGTVTHFVSSMGTTGTIMGTGRYLKEQNPAVQIVGVQPREGPASRASAAGRRRTCPRSTTRPAWTASSMSRRSRRSRRHARLLRGRAYSAAFPRAVQ